MPRKIKCDDCLELDLPVSELRLYLRWDWRTFYYRRAICCGPCFRQTSKCKEKSSLTAYILKRGAEF